MTELNDGNSDEHVDFVSLRDIARLSARDAAEAVMTQQGEKLLPCPFCGKPPTIVCSDNSYGSALITCGDQNECLVDLTAWGDLNDGETIEDAEKAWNTRAPSTPAIDDEGLEAACRAYSEIVWGPGAWDDCSEADREPMRIPMRAAIEAIRGSNV
jgi:hypothetical protein